MCNPLFTMLAGGKKGLNIMIKQYTKKDGTKAYMLSLYLGKDPITNKEKRTTRRGLKSMREAKILEAKLRMEVQNEGYINNDITYLSELYPLWLEQYRLTVKESTLRNVIFKFKACILPLFENIPIKKITIPYAQKIVNEWFKDYKSFKLNIAYTKLLFDYAVKLQVIKSNPFAFINAPKQKESEQQAEYKYYSSDELKLFLKLIENDSLYYALYRTLAFTGMRKSELLALTWNDVDFKQSTININKTLARNLNKELISQTPKSNASKRIISIDNKTLQALKEWRNFQRVECLKFGFNTSSRNQHIFTKCDSNKLIPPESLTRSFRLLCEKNNFKYIKVHGFRHTHCSLLFEAGATLQEVQERLGHSDIQTTMRVYAHVTEKQREHLAEKFANYVDF